MTYLTPTPEDHSPQGSQGRVMDPVQQVYCTAHFDWVSTSPWYGEGWQIGMRLACVPKIGAPQMGDTFELAPSATAETKGVTGSFVATTALVGTVDYQQTFSATWAYAPQSFTLGLDEMKKIVEAYATYFVTLRSRVVSKSRLVAVKIAPIKADGSYGAGASEFRLRTPMPGTGTGNVLPPELAIAQSVGADVLGRRGRGRWFMGALDASSALSPDGLVAATYAASANAAAKALIDSIQGIDNTIPASGQLLTTVTSAGALIGVRPSYCRVGNHADAQRRRQHQVVESYTVQAL